MKQASWKKCVRYSKFKQTKLEPYYWDLVFDAFSNCRSNLSDNQDAYGNDKTAQSMLKNPWWNSIQE